MHIHFNTNGFIFQYKFTYLPTLQSAPRKNNFSPKIGQVNKPFAIQSMILEITALASKVYRGFIATYLSPTSRKSAAAATLAP